MLWGRVPQDAAVRVAMKMLVALSEPSVAEVVRSLPENQTPVCRQTPRE